MSISRQTKIFSIIIVLLSAGFGYAFWETTHTLSEQTETNRVTQAMIRGLFELNIITNEYIHSRNERTKTQWNNRHHSLEELFEKANEIITPSDDVMSLNKIMRNEVQMETQFLLLIRSHETQTTQTVNQQKLDHIESQIRISTQEMLSEASRMGSRSLERLKDIQRQISLLSITLIIALCSVALISTIFINRIVLRPVLNLQKGAATLTEGNYDNRIEINGNNEISALARSYNVLASEIRKRITAITEKSDRLNESQKQLLELNENLQLMVDEQTADLRDSEIRQRTILETMLDAVISLDKDSKILSANPAACHIFGYSEKDMIGKKLHSIIDMNTEFSGNELDHKEHQGYHKEGHKFPVELTLTEMEIDNELMYTCIARDITERKRVDKMKSEFVSTVSHELRTPLTAIRGSLGLIMSGVTGELPEKSRDLLVLANNNTQRLLHLINDILDIQKIEAGKLEFEYQDIDLMSAVEKSVIDNTGYAEEHNVRIIIGQRLENTQIHVDPFRLAQVLANLLSNAAKFSHKNGIVTIDTCQDGDYAKVSVIDKGEGIPLKFQPKLFDKFIQNDSSNTRQKGGTGLGLSITKLMIEKMGGQIDFTSEEGKGTTFNIYFRPQKIVRVESKVAETYSNS